jgi:hypothetical protein
MRDDVIVRAIVVMGLACLPTSVCRPGPLVVASMEVVYGSARVERGALT